MNISHQLTMDHYVSVVRNKLETTTALKRDSDAGTIDARYSYMCNAAGRPTFIDLGAASDMVPTEVSTEAFIDDLIRVTVRANGSAKGHLEGRQSITGGNLTRLSYIVGVHTLLTEVVENNLDGKRHIGDRSEGDINEIGAEALQTRINRAEDAVFDKLNAFEGGTFTPRTE